MATVVNFKKGGKPVSKTFRSYDAIVRYFQTEITKLGVREKALGQKNPEIRTILEEDKKECERMVAIYKRLINERKTVRNAVTGETIEAEYR